jgi:integrase/recombinase XerC
MNTEALITRENTAERVAIERVMTSFWQGRSPHTIAAYRSDLEQFSHYLARLHACSLDTPQLELLRTFFGSSAGRANELVLNYRNELRDRDVAPKSINRKLSAIRSLVKLARLIGAVYWSIEVDSVRDELTRDTSGPRPDTIVRLLDVARQQPDPEIAARDLAMIRVLFDLGLRIGELVKLNLDDYDRKATPMGLWVLGKGRVRKVRLSVPEITARALNAWLTRRGKESGPLFLSFSARHDHERRLVTRGAYRIIRNLGRQIGIHLHPHMLRHSAITQAVGQSVALGLSLDEVRDFSRHRNINTLLAYRDRTTNRQSALANAISRTLKRD